MTPLTFAPPISGGTALATQAGVFVANADAGTIELVDPASRRVAWRVDVGPRDEPGRMARDHLGRVHVVLRGGGSIATLDPLTRTVTRTPVCPAPRGVDASTTDVRVACAGGELVSVPLDLSSTRLVARLGRDLRDVIAQGDRTVVTRLRSAEILIVDRDGSLLSSQRPPRFNAFEPEVAWRAAASPQGDALYVLHQYATSATIDTDPSNARDGSPYGSLPKENDCLHGSIVVGALTRFEDGAPVGTVLLPFASPLDLAVSSSGEIAVTHVKSNVSTESTVELLDRSMFTADQARGYPFVCPAPAQERARGTVVALAEHAGALYAQTIEPSALVLFDGTPNKSAVALTEGAHDAGRLFFHTPTSIGLACASCHPEGGDDGHTWSFVDIGPRRTQSLRGGVLDGSPLHWDGEMPDLRALVDDVFTKRMGGGHVQAVRLAALSRWLEQLPAPAPPSGLDPASIERGHAQFHRATCDTCHAGARLTNGLTMSVGTGGRFKVPSLIGVGARAPFMHDGCAPTMHDRLTDPFCAGVRHGDSSALTQGELTDLEVFLESL